MDFKVFTGIGFILGTALGSFTKELPDRSLIKQGINGRSYCPKCKQVLYWYDLLPVLSYLFLKGRCRYCQGKIGKEYLFVELLMGVLIAFIFYQAPYYNLFSNDYFKILLFVSDLVFKIFFVIVLISVALTDLKKMIIPDKIILPAIVISVIYFIINLAIKVIYVYIVLNQTLIGKALISSTNYLQRHIIMLTEPFLYSILAGIVIGAFFLSLIIITKGKGMGGGDVKLGAFLGLGLGLPYSLVALMLSFISGSIVGLFFIFTGRKKIGQHIPFGPYLVLGSIVALFWGDRIIEWYLHLSV